jgi:hypothetical protein
VNDVEAIGIELRGHDGPKNAGGEVVHDQE